jgi:ABC-type antimicrobial peptide transport system permease subunit
MLTKEIFSNVFRHPIRFFILSLSLGISVISVLLVLTILRTNELNSQPSLIQRVGLITLAFDEEASFKVSSMNSLKAFSPQEVNVTRVTGFRGINIRNYGFPSIESLRSFRPDIRLLQGEWANVGEALVTPDVCGLTKCEIGKKINIGQGSKDSKPYLVRGIIESKTPTTVFTIDQKIGSNALDHYFLLKTKASNTGFIFLNFVDELKQKKIKFNKDFTQYADRETQKSDFQLINYAFLALIGPLAGIALFSASLLVVFNFAVNRLERAKETAIKRALGASRFQIIIESLGEAVIVFVCAALPALGLGLLSLESLNRVLGKGRGQTLFFPEWRLVFSAGLVVLVLVLLSAFGPSIGMVREKPSLRLKEE